MTNKPDGLSDARAHLARQLEQALTDRSESRFNVIAFTHRHEIVAALATPPASTPTAIAAGEKLSGFRCHHCKAIAWTIRDHAPARCGCCRCRDFSAVYPSAADPVLPAGMKEWLGGDEAPDDWATPYLLRSGAIFDPGHNTAGPNWTASNGDIIAYTAAAPKAASEDGATGLREAVKLTIADAAYHLRKYRPHCLEALEAALAASPTDATGAEKMLEQAAVIAESYEPMGYMSDREREYCRDHGQEIADRIRIHVHSLNLPVAGETL